MTDKYDVYTNVSPIPVASALSMSDAEYIDFNMRVLGADEAYTRRNPRSDVHAIDAEIFKALGDVPKSFKAARAAVTAITDLDRRAKSELVQELKGLYEERDAAKFPAFADAVASTLKLDLSRNQEFFASDKLIRKLIECQASAFRDSVELEDRATFDNLSETEEALVVDLLVFLEAFVSVEEGAGAFATTSEFFTSLGALTPKQLRAVLKATSGLEFEKSTGSHYAPYVMMYIQTLFAIDSRAAISTFESIPQESRGARYTSIYEFIEGIQWPTQFGTSGTSCKYIGDVMQGTGVDTHVLTLSLSVIVGTNKKPGVSGSDDLLKVLRKSTAISADTKSLSVLGEVFMFAKAINISITDPDTRPSLLGSAYSKARKDPTDGFKILKNKLKAPPSIEPAYIWDNYVQPPIGNDIHYLEWGFTLYGAMFKVGMGLYDDSDRGQIDSEICSHLGSEKGRKDLEALIEFCEVLRSKNITSKDIYKDRDLMDAKATGLEPKPLPIRLAQELGKTSGAKVYTRIVGKPNELSLQTLCTNLLCAALDIEDPYDLAQFEYEVVNREMGGVDFSIALSTPYNPLELVSGYRTLGSCCMQPYNHGTKASMTSFYGGLMSVPSAMPSRTAYVFAHNVIRAGKSKPEFVCAGTMYLPIFEVSYRAHQDPPAKSIQLKHGTAGISVLTEGLVPAYPDKSRSFDGFEHTDEARGVPRLVIDLANQALVDGILQSSIAAQMGLLGGIESATHDSPAPDGLSMSVKAEFANGTYVDFSRPSATGILGGRYDVLNADTLFTDVTFELTDSDSMEFYVTYATQNGDAPRFAAAWDEMRYMWSLPKFNSFIPRSGTILFDIPSSVDPQVLDNIQELVTPAWFDGCDTKPLIREGRKLRKADLVKMRTPRKGILISTSSETAYLIEPE